MSKSSKKRNKKYSGSSAKSSDVVRVHRLNAVVRSDFSQWIHDRKKIIKNTTIATVVIGLVIFLIVQAFIAIS